MDVDELHRLAHKDAIAAWPHFVAFVESGRSSDMLSEVWDDIVSSNALPTLIEDIERFFDRSERFQKLMLRYGDQGGLAGPEIDRLAKLANTAEEKHALVIEVDTLERPPRFDLRALSASLRGKTTIYRLRDRD